MTPKAFLQQVKKGPPAAAYLFVGDELFYRDHCRKALIQAALGDGRTTGRDRYRKPACSGKGPWSKKGCCECGAQCHCCLGRRLEKSSNDRFGKYRLWWDTGGDRQRAL
jgi:hypothetical protein